MIKELAKQWEEAPLWQKILISVILPVVLVGSFWYYIISPQEKEIRKLKEEHQRKLNELAKLSALIRENQIEKLMQEREEILRKIKLKQEEMGYIVKKEKFQQILRYIYDTVISNEGIVVNVRTSNFKKAEYRLGEGRVERVSQSRDKNQRRDRKNEKTTEKKTLKVVYTDVDISFVSNPMKAKFILAKLTQLPIVFKYKELKMKPIAGGNIYVDISGSIYFSAGFDPSNTD